tara:strand:+ start:71 stop:460 length:390 start_codon:yes stop_codon:yes gene_type:complete
MDTPQSTSPYASVSPRIWLGLIIPGFAQLTRGQWGSALGVFFAASFFWLTSLTILVVTNTDTPGPPLHLVNALSHLRQAPTVMPQLIYALVCALSLQVGAVLLVRTHSRSIEPETTPLHRGTEVIEEQI